MLIRIDLQSGERVYDQVATQIAGQILMGELEVGERLPAARDLADALGVNMHTILHAYQRLREDGLIELRRGRGAVVIGVGEGSRLQELVADAVGEARRRGVSQNALVALIRKAYGA